MSSSIRISKSTSIGCRPPMMRVDSSLGMAKAEIRQITENTAANSK